MIQIGRMMGIIVALMFGVVVASFVFSMGASAEGIASGELRINNTQQMAQLVLYDASIAYQCTPEQGGYEIAWSTRIGSYWSAWSEYRDVSAASATPINWGHLEAAGSNLECYGSTTKLPGSQGALEIDKQDTWLNDQGGAYSRKDFRITKDNVQLGPCLAYENGDTGKSESDPQDIVFLFTDESVSSVTNYAADSLTTLDNTGPDYNLGAGTMNPGNCIRPGSSSGDTTDAAVSTVTVMNPGSNDGIYPSEGWDHVGGTASLAERGDTHFSTYKYNLCKGTRGYIQTNVGKNTVETSRSSDYAPNDPPGVADRETGNDREANIIHPFIVFTNWNDDCNP